MRKMINAAAAGAGGAIVGMAATGLISVNPVLAAAAPILSAVVQKVGEDALQAVLTNAERARTTTVIEAAQAAAQRRIDAGESIRADFLSWNEEGRVASEELLEGVIQKAKNSYEERKISYLGSLYASIAFDTRCTRDEGNYLIRLADVLSYTQFCLLALYAQHGQHELRDCALDDGAVIPHAQQALIMSSVDLRDRKLVRQLMRGNNQIFEIESHPNGFLPADAQLSDLGERVYKMLQLAEMGAPEYMYLVDGL